ncbi:hypothetical protein PYW08_009807 [Mythimna loreyi]|uniref:Uncharacterized protein n=1 Tax=Mythimna loreyi TaxID=667449 RepID=A0ACC2Q848_9NEOP|nr:hypothetical protein PYW08_009807 [Mythimna loreyi]
MTSHRVENVHLELLRKLLSDSGLECFRSPQESTETSSSSLFADELGPAEEESVSAPELPEEQLSPSVTEEESQEALPEIFPTPSLRLLLSDRVRVIEKQNRIHVLPEDFKTQIDPQAIPKILSTPQQKYIDILADLVGCTRYKSSLAEFWFLDTLANLLRRAQEDDLDRPTQAILILWFCEWMKEMQHFDAADRQRMIRRFQDNMLAAARYIVETEKLPTPEEAGVMYKPLEPHEVRPRGVELNSAARVQPQRSESKSKVHFGGSFECCIRDLAKIIHYIFDLFSTDYQYNLVRSVFTFSPEYALIEGPYQLQNPKSIYIPLKFKAKKAEKKDKSPKNVKEVKRGKKKEADNEEYLAFLEKKAAAERILDEQEEIEMEKWNRKSHILPLTFAADEEFFNKYWPPPPPPPVVVTPTDSPGKGKGKKKNAGRTGAAGALGSAGAADSAGGAGASGAAGAAACVGACYRRARRHSSR